MGTAMCFEPFRDPRNERRPLCNVWLNMQPFTCSKRIQTSIFFLFVCIDGGQKRGGEINYASSSTASNHALSSPHSCECIGPLRDDYQSEHNPRKLSPKVTAAAFFEHATIHCTGLSLRLFLLLCKGRTYTCLPAQSLWITQVQRPIYASMIHSL